MRLAAHPGRPTSGATWFALWALGLALVLGAFAGAAHHHDDHDAPTSRDACALCVVGKVVAAAPPSPARIVVAAAPSRVESVAPAPAPSTRRESRREGRGPPRG